MPIFQKGFAPIIFIIAVLVVSAGIVGGAYYYKITLEKPKVSEQKPVTPRITPVPSRADETANWKTYTNLEYSFTFRYPNNFKPGATSGLRPIFFLYDPNKRPVGQSDFGMYVFTKDQWSMLPLDDLLPCLSLETHKHTLYPHIKIKEPVDLYRDVSCKGMGGKTVYVNSFIIFKHNDNLFMTVVKSPTSFDDISQDINQILSTFKFLDQKQDVSMPTETLQPQSKLPTPVLLVIQDLANRLTIPTANIQIKTIQGRIWSDTCLGLPAPELCAPGEAAGYQVTLVVSGQEYYYHTDKNELFRYAGDKTSVQKND